MFAASNSLDIFQNKTGCFCMLCCLMQYLTHIFALTTWYSHLMKSLYYVSMYPWKYNDLFTFKSKIWFARCIVSPSKWSKQAKSSRHIASCVVHCAFCNKQPWSVTTDHIQWKMRFFECHHQSWDGRVHHSGSTFKTLKTRASISCIKAVLAFFFGAGADIYLISFGNSFNPHIPCCW